MKHIGEAVLNYLNMETTGALLLTGDWGSGKTFYVKNNLFPKIGSKTDFTPIIVSLFGETDKNNIAQKVLFAFLDKKGKGSNISIGTIVKSLKGLAEATPWVKRYVNVEKLFLSTGDSILRLLPHEKILICFDDIERLSPKLDVNDFLGVVNELVENKGFKVLLVANAVKISNLTFIEKTVEKTLHFSPDIPSVLEGIVKSYMDSPFKDYFIKNKDFILETLDPKIEDNKEQEGLKESFSNIRTLKFSIEHFKYCFRIITNEKNIDDELTQKQLINLWVFTLAISVEFKKPNSITYSNRRYLDEQVSLSWLSQIDFSGDLGTEGEEEENKWEYSEKVKKLYFDRLSETYIFHPDVYDLITSGKTISAENFINSLDERFNVVDGKVNPAHQLLQSFMTDGYWNFSNQEFNEKLKDLLHFVENGRLEDLLSYLNAGSIILEFINFINLSKGDAVVKIKKGITQFLSDVNLKGYQKHQFGAFSGYFNTPQLQEVIAFTKQKLSEVEIANSKQEVQSLEILFCDDVETFVKELFPKSLETRTPDKPIFHKFDQALVKGAISKWEPKGIVDFSSLLKIRYLDAGFSERLTDEISFLDAIEAGIREIDLDKNALSNYLIKKELAPVVEQSKEKLEGYKNSF